MTMEFSDSNKGRRASGDCYVWDDNIQQRRTVARLYSIKKNKSFTSFDFSFNNNTNEQ